MKNVRSTFATTETN